MEEKIMLRVHQKGAKKIAIISGISVAVVVFCLCLAIWDPRYYAENSLLGAVFGGLIVGTIVVLWLSKIELVISDKRVYGVAGFGKRVDLPLDSISAIGTGWLQSVHVTTASGSINFYLMPNYKDIHSMISKLLVERQQKPMSATTINQAVPQSTADELKKYKELLDSGVISQEEFDAKKKQLLGL